jgi:hypothetical protein
VSDVAVYRQNADELMRLALTAMGSAERARMIALAAEWHMRAQDIERGGYLQAAVEWDDPDERDLGAGFGLR